MVGRLGYNYSASGVAANYRACMIGSTNTNSSYASQQTAGSASGNTMLVATAIINVSTETATVYLNAQQGSGADLNIPASTISFSAVRLNV